MTWCTVVWFGNPELRWSYEWIKELLKDTPTVHVCYPDTKNVKYHECSIIVSDTSTAEDYIKNVDAQNKPFGVVLLSDETLSTNLSYLNSPNCKFVARNYFHPLFYNHPKVFVFGLGYKTGFIRNQRKNSDKKFMWSFAGSLKSDRNSMIAACSSLMPFQLNIFKNFNDPLNLTAAEYADLLSKSIFVPAPQGGASIDSFRIYEALEAGSIPVVTNNGRTTEMCPSYWHFVFQGEATLPFISENSWEEATTKMNAACELNKIDEMQQNCATFWQKWKNNWKIKFKNTILSSFSEKKN